MTYLNKKSAIAASLLLSTMLSTTAIAQEQGDEIIVTGSPLVNSVDEALTGVSVLTGDELLDRLESTIGETLKREPGLSSTFFGAGASRPIIRGQGDDRVRILTNGVGTIDAAAASPDHAVAAEPAQAERIEVVRGASLLRYGSSGSAGVVNVIDGRIPREVPEDGLDGAVRFGVSSVDLGREVAGSIDYGIGSNLVLHLDGTWREADDYKIPGEAESEIFEEAEEAEAAEEGGEGEEEEEIPDTGQLDNSFAESASLSGGLSFIGENGFFGVSAHHFVSDYGVPGGHHEEEGEEEEEEEEEGGVTIDLEQTRFDLNAGLELDGFFEKVELVAGYADYEHTEFEGNGEAGTVFTNEGFEARAEAVQANTSGWGAAYGLQFRDSDFSAIGEEAFVPETNTQQFGAFTFQEFDLSSFHVEGAARFESTSHENIVSGDDNSFDLISLSAGADYHFNDAVRLGGTLFRTERAPTSVELFADGPHLATAQFEVGDPNLGKETATGVEASLRYRNDRAFITANAFYTDYDDFVFLSGTDEEEDGLQVFNFIAEDASFQGFEVQVGNQVAKAGAFNVSVDGLAEYVRADTESGDLPRIPPLSLLGGIEAESDLFKFRGEVDYASSQNRISEFELPTESYTLVNGFITWKYPAEQDVSLKLSVLNLFNSEARQHASFVKDLVPLPGRNFRFSVTSRF